MVDLSSVSAVAGTLSCLSSGVWKPGLHTRPSATCRANAVQRLLACAQLSDEAHARPSCCTVPRATSGMRGIFTYLLEAARYLGCDGGAEL
jgi:hypothetical protein